MKKEDIDKFYEKYDFDKSDIIGKKFDDNWRFPKIWENPPIPKGKRLIFEVF